MATLNELKNTLRNQIGDTDIEDPNLSDDELDTILQNAADEYSRIKGYIKIDEQNYDKNENVYSLPDDSYKVKSVQLKENKFNVNFIDNTDQIYLLDEFDIDSDVLKITYTKYFKPEEVFDKEISLYLLYGEALCYKLLASKTAELFKFATGEKMVDESEISKKYLKLYEATEKVFRNRVIKAYGKRANNIKENLNYRLPYPPEGETP